MSVIKRIKQHHLDFVDGRNINAIYALLRTSVIAFSGQADTQSPHARQASGLVANACFQPCIKPLIFPLKLKEYLLSSGRIPILNTE
jgi:hypothetical protein